MASPPHQARPVAMAGASRGTRPAGRGCDYACSFLERSGATQSAAVANSACVMFLQLCKSRFDAGGWSSVSISSGSPCLHLRWQDSDLFRNQSGGEIEMVYAHLFLSDINSRCTS
jgi:hypothetical protein